MTHCSLMSFLAADDDDEDAAFDDMSAAGCAVRCVREAEAAAVCGSQSDERSQSVAARSVRYGTAARECVCAERDQTRACRCERRPAVRGMSDSMRHTRSAAAAAQSGEQWCAIKRETV